MIEIAAPGSMSFVPGAIEMSASGARSNLLSCDAWSLWSPLFGPAHSFDQTSCEGENGHGKRLVKASVAWNRPRPSRAKRDGQP
jgi:hypothetical protein